MANDTLKVAIAAGGTAGHINPALALAEELVRRGAEVCFYGQPTRLEASLVPAAGFDFFPIEVSGFDRAHPLTLVKALVQMRRATQVIGQHFEASAAPDVAIGFGAYVEMPLLRACSRRGIPTLIHEQNSVVGLANKSCAKTSTCVCCALPAAADAIAAHAGKATRVVVTGNPVRRSILDATRAGGRAALGIAPDARVLLVFGGSLGAHHLNEAVIALKEQLLADAGLVVLHASGAADEAWAREQFALSAEEQERWRLTPYIDDMASALAAADLVLSRSGASTLAEIAARALPAILVPYPHATADHQTTNAHFLVDAGAAELVRDDDLDTPAFSELLFTLLRDDTRREQMHEAAEALGQAHAAEHVADEVEAAAQAAMTQLHN